MVLENSAGGSGCVPGPEPGAASAIAGGENIPDFRAVNDSVFSTLNAKNRRGRESVFVQCIVENIFGRERFSTGPIHQRKLHVLEAIVRSVDKLGSVNSIRIKEIDMEVVFLAFVQQ